MPGLKSEENITEAVRSFLNKSSTGEFFKKCVVLAVFCVFNY